MNTLSDRIKLAFSQLPGLSESAVAKAAGMSQPTFNELKSGAQKSTGKIVQLARALNVSPLWLSEGQGPMRSDETMSTLVAEIAREGTARYGSTSNVLPPRIPSLEDHGVAYVSKVAGARLSAGNGEFVWDFEQIDASHSFRLDWLQKHKLKAERCKLWEVSGDSMWPTIASGSLVLINLAEREPQNGKIFGLVGEDGLRLKRLIKRQDGVWEIHSDNPQKNIYPTELFVPGAVAIMGRVRWQASDL